ncbi:MAG: adenosylcobinamide-GDP ribazoletransferase [Clostridiales bacterium]|nr:MAG: adenosylcobinamide-GDP ribazoletransferase [Clostridiales bacterium]
MSYIRMFILAITFLTRIPISVKFDYNEEEFNKSYVFYPFVGLIVGVIIFSISFLSLPKSIMALFIILLYVYVVGGIHIDGIGDVFDGIFSARKRDRMMEIMKDSRIGSFGTIGIVLYFLSLYVGLYEIIGLDKYQYVILFMPVMAKFSIIIISGINKYARKEGSANIINLLTIKHSLIALIIMLSISYFIGINVLIAAFVSEIITILVVARISGILDGITGDVIGLANELASVSFIISYVVILNL